MQILKDEKFLKIADGIKPDAKKRVLLPKAVVKEGVVYHIYTNSQGQIMLDPQVTIPASEAWLYKNEEALALVRQGLSDTVNSRVSRVNLEEF